MKKVLEMLMILAIAASLSSADEACKDEVKKGEGVNTQHEQGHVCYNSIAFQAEALAKEGKDAEAIKMYEDAKKNPEYEHHIQFILPSLAKLYDKTKQFDKNIALWNEGHKKLIVFNLDPAKNEFKPYLKLKGFKEAVAKDKELSEHKKEVKKAE